jgi:AraC-like DNA-binding protein
MQEYNFNIFNLIIISGVIHGFIFSGLVLSRKKVKNNFFLALTVLFLSLSNLQYFIIDTNLTEVYPVFGYLFIPWQWLILPMFYFYVQKTINAKKIKFNIKFLLLLPFFIVLSIQVFLVYYKFYLDDLYVMPSHFGKGLYVYIEVLSIVFNSVIIAISYRKITFFEKKSFSIKIPQPETSWLKELIYIGFIICLLWVIALGVVIIFDWNKSYVFYPMWIGISVIVYWMGYIGLGKAQLLEERIALRELRNKDNTKILKPEKSTIKTETYNAIDYAIQKQKSYLDPNLSLESLAKDLDLKSNIISEAVNQNTNYNFSDYINYYRVAEAKKMLTDPVFSNYTIVAIGLEAGFNSKASFYRAFRKSEGKTPSEFLKK